MIGAAFAILLVESGIGDALAQMLHFEQVRHVWRSLQGVWPRPLQNAARSNGQLKGVLLESFCSALGRTPNGESAIMCKHVTSMLSMRSMVDADFKVAPHIV